MLLIKKILIIIDMFHCKDLFSFNNYIYIIKLIDSNQCFHVFILNFKKKLSLIYFSLNLKIINAAAWLPQ